MHAWLRLLFWLVLACAGPQAMAVVADEGRGCDDNEEMVVGVGRQAFERQRRPARVRQPPTPPCADDVVSPTMAVRGPVPPPRDRLLRQLLFADNSDDDDANS
jgi:hypothetical protein